MGAARWAYIPDVLEEHLEELGFLWEQWTSAQRSPNYTRRSVADLEERIRAHLQGVLAVGPTVLPRLGEGLAAEDPIEVFPAAYALLHFRDQEILGRVIDAFEQATPPRLHALQSALAYAPLLDGRTRLAALLDAANGPLAIAAALVLARQRALRLTNPQLHRLLQHEDPTVRAGGWQLASQLTAVLEPKFYAMAVRDDDPAVQLAALQAGAWCGQHGVLAALRQTAQQPAPEKLDALYLFAVLGTPEHLSDFKRIADVTELGPARFHVLGAFGHPALMDGIIEELAAEDPASAAAAGVAFEKMTGFNVESGAVVAAATVPAEDEFEAEFQEPIMLPDPASARGHWDSVRARLEQSPRLCRGADMSKPLGTATFDAFDMESRWETWLRSRFYGTWKGTPLDLEVFPATGMPAR